MSDKKKSPGDQFVEMMKDAPADPVFSEGEMLEMVRRNHRIYKHLSAENRERLFGKNEPEGHLDKIEEEKKDDNPN